MLTDWEADKHKTAVRHIREFSVLRKVFFLVKTLSSIKQREMALSESTEADFWSHRVDVVRANGI